eukprot:5640297-Ditylum_brightwellii.AAC.1
MMMFYVECWTESHGVSVESNVVMRLMIKMARIDVEAVDGEGGDGDLGDDRGFIPFFIIFMRTCCM